MSTAKSTDNRAALQNLLKSYIAAHGRDRLISEAGISITTLSSLLAWEFEWSGKKSPPSERQRRAWAKTFVRLSAVLQNGNKPENWIGALGWEMGHELQDALRKGEEELALRKENLQEAEKLDILQRVRLRKEIKVGRLVYGVLGLKKDTYSFHHRLVSRLFGTLAPGYKISPTDCEEMEGILASLVKAPYNHDVVIGVLDTPARRFAGVNFIPLRGWTVHINGIYFQRNSEATPPKWWELSRPRHDQENPTHTLMAIPKEAAHDYFSGTCCYRKNYLIETKSAFSNSEDLAEEFEKYALNLKGGDLIFVADDETCRRIHEILNAPRRLSQRGCEAKLLEDFKLNSVNREAPCYTLAMAIPLSAPLWLELIRETIDKVTYGTDWRATAELYVDQIILAHHDRHPVAQILPNFFDLHSPAITRNFWVTLLNRIASTSPDLNRDDSFTEYCSQIRERIDEPAVKLIDTKPEKNLGG